MATLTAVTIDCKDPQRLSIFWALALDGYSADESGRVVVPDDGKGPTLYFQAVPEARAGKNRLHLDIASTDLKGEVFRLERNGASVVEEMSEEGNNWVIMADPEGNEFCVSPAASA